MDEVGFEEIRVYILKRQNAVAQYIATQNIIDLCKRSVQRPGAWVYRKWWEQEVIELTGASKRATAAEDGEEERGREEVE